jgi:hypothetical protein
MSARVTERAIPNLIFESIGIMPHSVVRHSQRQQLVAAMDLGIPGLVAYIAIWAATFRLLRRVWRKTQDPIIVRSHLDWTVAFWISSYLG